MIKDLGWFWFIFLQKISYERHGFTCYCWICSLVTRYFQWQGSKGLREIARR